MGRVHVSDDILPQATAGTTIRRGQPTAHGRAAQGSRPELASSLLEPALALHDCHPPTLFCIDLYRLLQIA